MSKQMMSTNHRPHSYNVGQGIVIASCIFRWWGDSNSSRIFCVVFLRHLCERAKLLHMERAIKMYEYGRIMFWILKCCKCPHLFHYKVLVWCRWISCFLFLLYTWRAFFCLLGDESTRAPSSRGKYHVTDHEFVWVCSPPYMCRMGEHKSGWACSVVSRSGSGPNLQTWVGWSIFDPATRLQIWAVFPRQTSATKAISDTWTHCIGERVKRAFVVADWDPPSDGSQADFLLTTWRLKSAEMQSDNRQPVHESIIIHRVLTRRFHSFPYFCYPSIDNALLAHSLTGSFSSTPILRERISASVLWFPLPRDNLLSQTRAYIIRWRVWIDCTNASVFC